MSHDVDVRVNSKAWLEVAGKPVLGKGLYRLLAELSETRNLTDAAARLKYSYKYAWNLLRRLKLRTGLPAVKTEKGGKGGGGKVTLTEWGAGLLKAFEDLERAREVFLVEQQERLDQFLKNLKTNA
ncbi:MAG: winged helix-turn-helix domain-containing protein [Promethearchaeota archaeon]